MATTEQVRQWYPQWVLNHADRGKPGFKPQCRTVPAVVIDFPKLGGGDDWRLPVHALAAEAFEAYVWLMRLHGVAMAPAGGVHNCRNIAGSNMPSLHAYGVCIDLPPNSYKPGGFLVDVLAIRTKSGARVWRNLADANDRMHDQIDCSPADLASGIDWKTVAGHTPPDPEEPVIPDHLNVRTLTADQIFERGERDGTDSTFEADMEWMLAQRIATTHTHPDGVPRNEELAAFLHRLDRHLIRPLAARLTAAEARIAILESSAGGPGGVSEARVRELIADTRLVP